MKRILVIEDEPAVRESILDILDAEGFSAVGAENGKIGVDLVQQFHPNLILCDVMMPEYDGHQVLQQLRLNPQTETIPFIFLTAKVDRTDVREGMSLGADDYLTKPFTHEELLQTIAIRLDKQEAFEQQSKQKMDELRQSITFALPRALTVPLGQISHLAATLIEDHATVTPVTVLETAEAIQTNTKVLRHFLHNFMLYAKLELIAVNPEQVKTLRQAWVDDSETVIADAAIKKADRFGRQADLELDLQPVSVQMAENKLKKIVEELVDNAFRFSNPGSPIKVCSLLKDDRFVLHIIDYGRGMTAEQIHSLGAYMQFEAELFDEQGPGLGLTISRRLVEIHGGEFSIESIPGKQTIIRISLPC